MKATITIFFLTILSLQYAYAQQPPTETIKTAIANTPIQQKIIDISKQKWQWMADKNVDELNNLFDKKSMFIHMGGTWGKDVELNTIKKAASGIKKPKCIQ